LEGNKGQMTKDLEKNVREYISKEKKIKKMSAAGTVRVEHSQEVSKIFSFYGYSFS
jgi:hypothetical protein